MPRPEWPASSVPIVEVAVEPKSVHDTGRLRAALAQIAAADAQFLFKVDEESGQTIIGGTG